MLVRFLTRPVRLAGVAAVVAAGAGCSGLREWHANGFKVGPNYTPPVVYVAEAWSPAADPRLTASPADLRAWWAELHDPVLTGLLATAGDKNPALRRAALKVAELEAVRGKTKGNLYPQSQKALLTTVSGTISENLVQGALENKFDIWADGMLASWELDLWGRYRRAVEAADADLAGAVEAYRDTLAGLLADTTAAYLDVRVYQQRLAFARETVAARKGALAVAESRFKNGNAPESDVWRARLGVAQAEAAVPPLELGVRQAGNRLAVLLGQPAHDIVPTLAPGGVPTAPPVLAVGVPADLLRRRPDVRKAERDLAAQSARIGVAKSDLYPAVSVFGFFGYTGTNFPDLFNATSYTGIVSPSIDWKILNYGRVRKNIQAEDLRFQQLAVGYEQAVLTAGKEVEDGLAGFLNGLAQADRQQEAATAADKVLALTRTAFEDGNASYEKVYDAQANALAQKDALLTARRDALMSLVKTYRALGGGWDTEPGACVTGGSGSGPRTTGAVVPGG